MKTRSELRATARRIRDKVIQSACNEYKRALARISNGKSNRRERLSTCVELVLPRDREFSILDVLAALEAMDPVRVWRKQTVNNQLSRLLDRGAIRRTRRHCGKDHPAIYACVGVDVPKRPFEDVSLRDVMAAVQGNRTMNATELTVAIVEAGYETRMSRKALRDAVGAAMRKGGRFKKVGEKWSVHRQKQSVLCSSEVFATAVK